MKLNPFFMVFIIGLTFASAEAFKGYRELAKECKEDIIKTGNYATVNDVKKALTSHDWIVADVRTKEEWNSAFIKGSYRIGRASPEEMLANVVLDHNDNFEKKKYYSCL